MIRSKTGVTLEEGPGGGPAIARFGTARTAFVGRTLRGPVDRPVLLKSFAEFQAMFGGLWQPSTVSYAVEHFFDNGGCEALVVRVVNGARASTLKLPAAEGCLELKATRPGTREFLRASVDYDNIPADVATQFNLTVQRVRVQGTEQVDDQEIFRRLSIEQDAERFVGRILAESELVTVTGAIPAARPRRTLDAASGLATGYLNSSADGDDGEPLSDYDLIGSEVQRTGLFALEAGDYFNFLCIPPLVRERDIGPSVLLVAARYCRKRRALLIVDPPADWETADEALHGMRSWELSNENAVMYFPRILAHDKLRGHFESFAPCGAVAGMLARADETSPVWGPMRVEEVVLRPGYRPSCLVTEDRRARLAAAGVNTLHSVRSTARGIKPRTLAAGNAGDAQWQSLAARRLALFILNSIEHGTRWAVCVPWRFDLAAAVAAQVRSFFEKLHHAGTFGMRSPQDSFFVMCDGPVNAPRDAAAEREFQLVIGFAAAREREFHSFRILHSAAGSMIRPVSLNRLNGSQHPPAARQLLADPLET